MPVADYLPDNNSPDVMYSPMEDEYTYQRRLAGLEDFAQLPGAPRRRRPMDEQPVVVAAPDTAASDTAAPTPPDTSGGSDYIGPGGGLGEDVGPADTTPPQDTLVGPGGGLGEDVLPEDAAADSGRGGGGIGGTITPSAPGAAPLIAPTTPTPGPGGMPPGPDYAKWEKAISERPVMTPPKWWQRLGAAAAGFGAGWSNAAGRTRNPIDIAAMKEGILHPLYAERLAQWQSRYTPIEAQAKLEAERQGAWWKNQQMQAQAQYLKAHADYMKGLGRGENVPVTPEMEKASGGIFKAGTTVPYTVAKEIFDISQGRYTKAAPVTVKITDPDIAKRLGKNVGEEVPTAVYQEAIRYHAEKTPKNLNVPDVLLHPEDFRPDQVAQAHQMWRDEHREPKEKGAGPSKAQSAAITARKNSRLIAAEAKATAAIRAGQDPTDVYADLAREKQQAQNDFEDEIEAAGGAAEHFEYPTTAGGTTGSTISPATSAQAAAAPKKPAAASATTAAPKAPTPAGPPPPPPKPGGQFTEAEARATAQRRGIDPDTFVARARQRNLIK